MIIKGNYHTFHGKMIIPLLCDYLAVYDTETSCPESPARTARELHPANLAVRDEKLAKRGPDGRQGSVGAACAASPCAAPRLCEGKATAGI